MYFLSPTVDSAIFTLLAILIPTILTALSGTSTPSSAANTREIRRITESIAPYRPELGLALTIHTLFILYHLIFAQPPNIFTFLNAPLSIPGPRLRDLLQSRINNDTSGEFVMSPGLEDLITRLSSFDVRTNFIRFGQQAVESCIHCHTLFDYALYSLPRPLLEYVREVAFIGLLTVHGSGPVMQGRRTLGVALLMTAGIGEAAWLYTVPIALRNTRDVIYMWHDLCWTFRQLLFLTMPLIMNTYKPLPPIYPPSSSNQQPVHTPPPLLLRLLSRLPFPLSLISCPLAVAFRLPSTPPPPQLNDSLLRTARTTDAALGRLTLLKVARGAILRDDELREKVGRYWEVHAGVGRAIRTDETVKQGARTRGLGYTCFDDKGDENAERVTVDGKEGNTLGNMAREAIDGLKKIGFSPVS